MAGRPSFFQTEHDNDKFREEVDRLRRIKVGWSKIARLLSVSRQTLYNWKKDHEYEDPIETLDISDETLDAHVKDVQKDHPSRGEKMTRAYLSQKGVHVPRQRVRESIHRTDPEGVEYRKKNAVRRVVYNVKGPHHLWHVDGNHKLKDFGLAIEGAIDGFSRTCVCLKALASYGADPILDLFKQAVHEYTLPSRVRVDKGTENVRVAEYMVNMRGPDRGSIIAGPSTRNQRIERLWGDVRPNVIDWYITVFNEWVDNYGINFYYMRTKFVIHHMFLDRLNEELELFRRTWNSHPLSTEHQTTPDQLVEFNKHLIKEPPFEIDEENYGFEGDPDLEGAVLRHQMEYDPVTHPFDDEQLARFVFQNPKLCIHDNDTSVMWQRVEHAFRFYDEMADEISDSV
jgi:transposase-like protein